MICFVKNENISLASNLESDMIDLNLNKNGNIKIDTTKYDYNYVVSTIGCDCSFDGNFKIQLINNFLKWEIERILWIAFEKNENNEQCFLADMPKDIINHIKQFLMHCN